MSAREVQTPPLWTLPSGSSVETPGQREPQAPGEEVQLTLGKRVVGQLFPGCVCGKDLYSTFPLL